MFVLMLNDMRGRAEGLTPVARGRSAEVLQALLVREAVTPYDDYGTHYITHDTDTLAQMAGREVVETIPSYRWHKLFRRGGPFEWYNPPYNVEEAIREVGSEDSWAEQAREEFRMKVLPIPEAPDDH